MSDGKALLPEGSPFELWDVRLMSGDVKMTVDELDAAFASGRIDSGTLVRRRGMIRWATLGEAAGLDEPAPSTTPQRPAVPRPATAPRRAVPPPLPPSVVAQASTPEPPPDIVLPPLLPPDEPAPHLSSLPPPVTVSTSIPPATPEIREPSVSLGEETAAAIAELRRPRGRGKMVAALLFAAVIGGGVVTAVKVPSLKTRVATALHLEKPAAPAVAATPPPPATPVAPEPAPPPVAMPVVPEPAPLPAAAPSASASTTPAVVHRDAPHTVHTAAKPAAPVKAKAAARPQPAAKPRAPQRTK